MAKWNEKKTKIIYDSYDEFVEIQAGRTSDELLPFDPKGLPQINADLSRFYPHLDKGDRILDAGCRDGWTLLKLDWDGYENAVGIDVVPRAIEFCAQRGVEASVQDCEELSFADGEFDAIFCRHTLEHVINPKKALKEFCRITRSGGIIFIVIPIEPGKEKLRARRSIEFGHSHVFESSHVFRSLIEGLPIEIVEEFPDEKTPKYMASTFVLRRA